MVIKTTHILLFIIIFINNDLISQATGYTIALAPFSSLKNDEFSPVFYNNGIVFCSNLKNNSLIEYSNENKGLFNMFFVSQKDSNKWSNPKLLSTELTTNFNEGPATFNAAGTVIYYCRNNHISELLRTTTDSTNKLGIYSAEWVDSRWANIKPFEHNNPLYTYVTPALNPNGNRLYFASDMPGGYGGVDLYYCNLKDGIWEKPVNMGAVINTSKNESFPFACKSGKLFFSSDGHDGLGMKDLFYTMEVDGKWVTPIHLDAEINSPYDDFGLVTDSEFKKGYFSSNRRKTDDIFHFSMNPVIFTECDSMVKNNYCFLFYDEYQNEHDSIPVFYKWDFGNGIEKFGLEVKHCFDGPGNYEVTLYIIDSVKTDSIRGKTSFKFELEDIEQVYINSPDAGIVNEILFFDGIQTNLPKYNISDYLWDFGEGFNIRGPVARMHYPKKGKYIVKLGLLGEKDSLGNFEKKCAFKTVDIYNDYQEWAMFGAIEIQDHSGFSTRNQKNATLKNMSLTPNMEENSNSAKTNSLKTKVYLLNNLTEMQKDTLYNELYVANYANIEISDSGIDSASQILLTQFAEVLHKNIDIKLEIAIHTSEQGFSGNNFTLSENWANRIASFFYLKGCTKETLHCEGYGESRPEIKQNSDEISGFDGRIEFIFCK